MGRPEIGAAFQIRTVDFSKEWMEKRIKQVIKKLTK